MKVYVINKNIGETPLEALRKFVKRKRLSPHGKYTYAGRLDPMAEGVLLILSGATQEQKERYLRLPKTYEAEILFGLSSDSGDLLGVPVAGSQKKIAFDALSSAVGKLVPVAALPIPAFSSVIVIGHPAFSFARAGRRVAMPQREMKIISIRIVRLRSVAARTVLARVNRRVGKVRGDFRQDRILRVWNRLLGKSSSSFQVAKITIHCGSGTYVRSIAMHLGRVLGTKALLYGLKRTAVGKFKVKT